MTEDNLWPVVGFFAALVCLLAAIIWFGAEAREMGERNLPVKEPTVTLMIEGAHTNCDDPRCTASVSCNGAEVFCLCLGEVE